MYAKHLFTLLLSSGMLLAAPSTQERSAYYTSPDAVSNLLADTKESQPPLFSMARYEAWKASLQENYALSLGADYHLVGFYANRSMDDKESLGGVFRLFGEWQMYQNNSGSGSLVFKLEHRHALSDLSPVDFSNALGYAGLIQSTFSDQQLRLTTLYWKQSFNDNNAVIYAGFLDVTEYVDVYLLISPWNAFGNMVFATGSATMGGLPDGALGVMAAAWLNDRTYIVGGIADANADPTDPFQGFETLFDDLETFKSIEIGWTTKKEALYFDNFHLTLWQMDARPQAGTQEGWGVNFSLTHTFNANWMGFLRGGYSVDGGALLERSISSGFGYKVPDREDIIGLGVNWGIPNDELYGDADAQWTSELFYRYQVGKRTQITPSLQLIADPALYPDTDLIALFGLRLEVRF